MRTPGFVACGDMLEAAARRSSSPHHALGRRGATSVIRPEHARSIRVATRPGARFDRAVPFVDGVAHRYVYPDPAGA